MHVSAAFDTVLNDKILLERLQGLTTRHWHFRSTPAMVQVVPVKQKSKNRSSRNII